MYSKDLPIETKDRSLNFVSLVRNGSSHFELSDISSFNSGRLASLVSISMVFE